MSSFHIRCICAALVTAVCALPVSAAVLETISLPARDPAVTAKWYASNFGGKRSGSSVKFGDITVTWVQVKKGAAMTNPAIAHLGFAVENTANKLAALQKAKVKVVRDAHAGPASNWAVVVDPNGMAVGIPLVR